MYKFFRKYQKYVIAVGGVLLLVIFLAGEAVMSLSRGQAIQAAVQATFVNASGERVRMAGQDYIDAQHDLYILSGQTGFNFLEAIGLGDVRHPEHWALLVHEAEAAGLMGGDEDGYYMLVREFNDPATANDVLIRAASQSGLGIAATKRAFQRLQGVSRLVQSYATAGSKISASRLAMVARDVLPNVNAQMVVIPARSDRDGLDEPDEAALAAHLEMYADFRPGQGPRGFGYRLPNQVKLEWLEIRAAGVRESLRESDRLSGLELRKYWLRHQSRFNQMVGFTGDDEEAGFAAAESRVRTELLEQITNETLDSIVRYAESELSRRTRELPRDGSYFTLPENWNERQVQFFDLAESVRERFGVPLPRYERRTEWLQPSDMEFLGAISQATTDRFGEPRRLHELAALTREFGGSENIHIQRGVAGPPLRSPDHSIFFFRITDTLPAHAPTTVDEVRNRLVRDLKRLQDYERLETRVDSLRDQVLDRGLATIAQEFNQIPRSVTNIGHVNRSLFQFLPQRDITPLPGDIGPHEETVNRIIEHGRRVTEYMLREGVSIEEVPIEELTFVIPVPDRLALVAVQIMDVLPVTQDVVEDNLTPLMMLAMMDELDEDGRRAFTYDAVRARFQLEIDRDRDAEDEELDAAEAASQA